jgi:hypothetical protein
MKSVSAAKKETQILDRLTETIVDKLRNPSTSSEFDFHEGVNQVLAITFYGHGPIIPSRIRFFRGYLFPAETPLGTYQRFDERAYLSRSPGSYRTVISFRLTVRLSALG